MLSSWARNRPGTSRTISHGLAIFTICSNNYLPSARIFLESVRTQHPEADLFLALADKAVNIKGLYDSDWVVIQAEELDIPNFHEFAFRYEIMEFNTALKPFIFCHLLEERGYDVALYFDPDIQVLQPLDSILRPLNAGASFVLTPHICEPMEAEEEPHDISIMRAGIYNLGFLGVARCEESLRIMHWWSRRLRFDCISAQDRGIFVDQKFMDLVPAFARNCHVSHDTSLNVAYWNLLQRRFEAVDDGWLVDGQKLTFFHFSGFDPRKPTKLSKYTTRLDGDLPAPLQQLLTQYAKRLLANGYGTLSCASYAYGRFASGTPIHPYVRRLFREWHQAWPDDPFSSYEEFLHQPSPEAAHISPGLVVTNFMKFIHDITPSLKDRLDLRNPSHGKDLVHWYVFHAERDILLSERMITPILARMDRHRVVQTRTLAASAASRADATVIGYLRTASGAGEAGRQTLRALASTGLAVSGYDVDLNVSASRDDQSCTDLLVTEGNGKAQIFHVNADQLSQVMSYVKPRLRSDAIRISVPFWELSEFPEAWIPVFDSVDEIWASSRFIQRALIRRVSKPVVYMPLAVELPPLDKIARTQFGLPSDKFIFFFAFDFLSFIERKNPHGSIAAFKALQMRIGRGRAALVIKSMNGRQAAAQLLALRAEIGDDPDIYLLDQTLSREETLGLISVADCVMSLHRSEGLGLLVAEAMLLGKPVIATDYSATTELVTPQTALAVDYRLVPVRDGEYPFGAGQIWAEPDVAHAAWQMECVFAGAESEPVTSMIARAREYVRGNHSRAHVGQLQARHLQRLIGG